MARRALLVYLDAVDNSWTGRCGRWADLWISRVDDSYFVQQQNVNVTAAGTLHSNVSNDTAAAATTTLPRELFPLDQLPVCPCLDTYRKKQPEQTPVQVRNPQHGTSTHNGNLPHPLP